MRCNFLFKDQPFVKKNWAKQTTKFHNSISLKSNIYFLFSSANLDRKEENQKQNKEYGNVLTFCAWFRLNGEKKDTNEYVFT